MNNNRLKSAKRDAMLDAAGAEFLKRGYLKTSTKSIALAAQITEKTLFQYFPSKLDILQQLIIRQYSNLAEKLREQVQGVDDAYQQYLRFSECYTQEIEEHWQFYSRPADIYRGLTRDTYSEESPALHNPVNEVLEGIIKRAIKNRALAEGFDPIVFVYTYLGSIDYFNRSHQYSPAAGSPAERQERMLNCAQQLWNAAERFNPQNQGASEAELMERLTHIADEIQRLGNRSPR